MNNLPNPVPGAYRLREKLNKKQTKKIKIKNTPKTTSESHRATNCQKNRALVDFSLGLWLSEMGLCLENHENSQRHKHPYYCLVGTYILKSKHNYDSLLIYELSLSLIHSFSILCKSLLL